MSESYADKLAAIQLSLDTRVCIGLDPDPDRIPRHLIDQYGAKRAVLYFVQAIVDATYDFAAAYKLNFAFFEALGTDGFGILARARQVIPDDRIVIADAKRGDIGNTARFYARSVFDDMNFDSITVSPYMGSDAVTPFLSYPAKCTYVLIRTSNAGSSSVQLVKAADGELLYKRVARLSREWSDELPGTLGFVLGATDIDALSSIRAAHPDTPLLIPGIGAQGGDAPKVLSALKKGNGPVLINSSRAILYSSTEPNFASEAAAAARDLRDSLRV